MSELKPCPFCGGEVHFYEDHDDMTMVILCEKCDYAIGGGLIEKNGKPSIDDIWNNRVDARMEGNHEAKTKL